MIKAPTDLQTTFGFDDNDDVNVLFESNAVDGKTTFYSQLWLYVTDFLIRKLPAQASTSRTTSNGKPCCVPSLRGVPGAGGKHQSIYRDDNNVEDGDGALQPLTGNKQKKTKTSGPVLNTVKSDSAVAVVRPRGRSSTDNSLARQSSSAVVAPFSFFTWFDNFVQAMAEFGIAQKATVDAGTAKFLRLTAKLVSHKMRDGVDFIVIFVPVITNTFRDLIRTQIGTKAIFHSKDLIVKNKSTRV
jgi:hypothetical protein